MLVAYISQLQMQLSLLLSGLVRELEQSEPFQFYKTSVKPHLSNRRTIVIICVVCSIHSMRTSLVIPSDDNIAQNQDTVASSEQTSSQPLDKLHSPSSLNGTSARIATPSEGRNLSEVISSNLGVIELNNSGSTNDQSASFAENGGNNASNHSALHNNTLMHAYSPSRVLFGIMSADFKKDCSYRGWIRELFQIWNDSRICSLSHFKILPADNSCEIIYTFVIGANPNATTSLIDDSRPFETEHPPVAQNCEDFGEADMTMLDIRENMNEGKSQTWMYYGSIIAYKYNLDYVAKCDTDTVLYLDSYFEFAHKSMPPAPFNHNMYIGAMLPKSRWRTNRTDKREIDRYEGHFNRNFGGIHVYMAGQLYIMSPDLANFVGKEAQRSGCSYCEGVEDHDIGTMVYHNPDPVKTVAVGTHQLFWQHEVKRSGQWLGILARERDRMGNATAIRQR
jgi:Galactosyltransferase